MKTIRDYATDTIFVQDGDKVYTVGPVGADRRAAMVGASYYDNLYRQGYDSTLYHALWDRVVARLHPDETIVDMGCGVGHFAQYLHTRGFRNYVGLDFSGEAIRQASRNAKMYDFRVQDITTGGLPPADVYLCMEVLEHIDNDFAVLNAIPSCKRVILTLPSFRDPAHVRTYTKHRIRYRYSAWLEDLTIERVWHRPWKWWYVVDASSVDVFKYTYV